MSRRCADRRFEFSRRSYVVVEQPTETLASTNAAAAPFRLQTLNQFIAEPLMVPFAMIMGDKLGHCAPKMALAKRNQPIETTPL